jgi:hypothetical protein
MSRLRPPSAPDALAVAAMALGLAAVVVGWVVLQGTPSPHVHGTPKGAGPAPTHTIDVIRNILGYAGVAVLLAGVYRWYTRGERSPGENEARRTFGDSIVDARTNQDPQVGMRPVDTTPPR